MRVGVLMAIAAVILTCVAQPATAQRGEVYCSITEITAEQVSNGVIVKIAADGELQGGWDFDRMVQSGAFEVKRWFPGGGMWIEPTEKCSRLCLRFGNARSKLGSCFIPVGKYPVSHVEVSIPDWAARHDGVGVYVDIVNYQSWVTGEGEYYRWRYDLQMFESDDRQGMIVAWLSDRFPPPPAPKTPEDLPTELTVKATPAGITLKAVNADLKQVMEVMARETGLEITALPESEVRVSCHLRNLTPEQVIRAVAMSSGMCDLCLPDGSWVLATEVDTSEGYATALTRRVPLRYLRAREATDLLPNCLLPYLMVDDEANAILVTGPVWMGERVASDLAELDQPPREVMLEVVAVEYTSAKALEQELSLVRYLGNWVFGFGASAGELSIGVLEGLPTGWEARLSYLESTSVGRIHSRTTLLVASGHAGRVFGGQQRTLILEQIEDSWTVANLETVDIGTSLELTPRLGRGEEVMLGIDLQLDNLRGTDPASGLPEISRRSTQSQVRVRNGDTVFIAGLEMSDQTRSERAIPVLSKLPLVGALFRAPLHFGSQTRLAVFVTPHIMTDRAAGEGAYLSG